MPGPLPSISLRHLREFFNTKIAVPFEHDIADITLYAGGGAPGDFAGARELQVPDQDASPDPVTFNSYYTFKTSAWALLDENGDELPNTQLDEAIGASGSQNYAGTLARVPLVPGTLTLTDGAQVVTDDGAGNLVGAVDGGGTNTIDYTTGAYDVDFAVVTTGNVTADYTATGALTVESVYNFDNTSQLDGVLPEFTEDEDPGNPGGGPYLRLSGSTPTTGVVRIIGAFEATNLTKPTDYLIVGNKSIQEVDADVQNNIGQLKGPSYLGASWDDPIPGGDSLEEMAARLVLAEAGVADAVLKSTGGTPQVMTNRLQINNNLAAIRIQDNGDRFVEFTDAAATLQGYLGRINSGTPGMYLLNAPGGNSTLSLVDSYAGENVLVVNAGGAGGRLVWHQGNDGHNSGLDADTLDGTHLSGVRTVSLFRRTRNARHRALSSDGGAPTMATPAGVFQTRVYERTFTFANGGMFVDYTEVSGTFFAGFNSAGSLFMRLRTRKLDSGPITNRDLQLNFAAPPNDTQSNIATNQSKFGNSAFSMQDGDFVFEIFLEMTAVTGGTATVAGFSPWNFAVMGAGNYTSVTDTGWVLTA